MTEWDKLRTWNGSKDEAFEELCTQLAAHEHQSPGSEFLRKAPPDAGVECLRTLANGEQWGWQSKFFTGRMGPKQWRQLTDSFRSALQHHPGLTRYYVCVPLDRSAPHKPREQWLDDKWRENLKKWGEMAGAVGRSVEFVWWGTHEIFERLTRKEHHGRRAFWFGDVELSPEKLERQVETKVDEAGERYTPSASVRLPILEIFDALGRTQAFWEQLRNVAQAIREAGTDRLERSTPEGAEGELYNLIDALRAVMAAFNRFRPSPDAPLEFAVVGKAIDSAATRAAELWDKVKDCEEKRNSEQQPSARHAEQISWALHNIRNVEHALREAQEFCSSEAAELASRPALIIHGEAGCGKTHLVCDAALDRARAGLPTVLLLGHQFERVEPWGAIADLLGLTCDRETLLGAMDAVAEAVGAKLILFIDAINEGAGQDVWSKHLRGFLSTLGDHPMLGVCLTIRNGYIKAVLPPDFPRQRVTWVEHRGFEGREELATHRYFQAYGIKEPDAPLLTPEFSNPLFLKLFCRAVQRRVPRELPSGVSGITAVFGFWMDAIHGHLSKKLDYDPGTNLVRAGVEALAERMATKRQRALPWSEAKEVLESLLPGRPYSQGLAAHFVAEGLLLVGPSLGLAPRQQKEEVVRFTYERLSDFLIVGRLLDGESKCRDDDLFAKGSRLAIFRPSQATVPVPFGWMEVLAVHLPETRGIEVLDAHPEFSRDGEFRSAFIQSLVWRKPAAITEATRSCLARHFPKGPDEEPELLNAYLRVAGRPDHALNADSLHRWLWGLPMPERDARWSTFLHDQYRLDGAVGRLIDWAWTDLDRSRIDPEVIRLSATALAWHLTAANRFVRDRATKALVSLLEDHTPILNGLLLRFASVDDPYVAERLLVVAHGCALRTRQIPDLASLGQYVYDSVFRDGTPPPHLLLREAARGVVEAAVARGCHLEYDRARLIPPYRSAWHPKTPSLQQLENRFRYNTFPDPARSGMHRVYHSVTNDDFSHYQLPSILTWSSLTRSPRRKRSLREHHDSFVQNLDPRQQEALEIYVTHIERSRILSRAGEQGRRQVERSGATRAELREQIIRTLTPSQRTLFRRHVERFLDDPIAAENAEHFSLDLARRWILNKVLELGYTSERFGAFDDGISSEHRSSHKAERIGKKYQWIAFDELIARVSDNFEFARGPTSPAAEPDEIDGIWAVDFRDIDPTLLIAESPHDGWTTDPRCWWLPPYTGWHSKATVDEWLDWDGDLPAPEDLLVRCRSGEEGRWLVLNGFGRWHRKEELGSLVLQEIPTQEVMIHVHSFLIRSTDMPSIWRWAQEQDFWGGWMPSGHGRFRAHLSEHYLPYLFPANRAELWEVRTLQRPNLPRPVMVSSHRYLCENATYDCSVDTTISIMMPCQWLAHSMKLEFRGRHGGFFDSSGKLMAFDPSVQEAGPGALLVAKDPLLDHLRNHGMELFWIIVGEKNFYPPDVHSHRIDWPGRLVFSGAFRFIHGKVEGQLHAARRRCGE